MKQQRLLALSLLAAAALSARGGSDDSGTAATPVSHVLLVSVDGLHQQDLAN